MTRTPLPAVLLLAACTVAEADNWALEGETWARPRSGEAVLQMPAVGAAVRAWQQRPGARIVLRYPGGEEGALWAGELRDWLVALGVASADIASVPGGLRADALILEVH